MEIFNSDQVVPSAFGLCELSKMSGKSYRGITQREYEKCRTDCFVFKGTECIKKMLDQVLKFKREAKRGNKNIVRYNLNLGAIRGSGFDSYVDLNNLTQWRTIATLIKN